MAREATAVMRLCTHPMSTVFFSKANVDELQTRLAQAVKARTGYLIDRQSDTELLGIMRGVYEAFSKHSGGKKEIARLNEIVLEIVIDQVVAGVEGYLGYLKDASTMPEPLDRGTFASIKGERTLEYRFGYK